MRSRGLRSHLLLCAPSLALALAGCPGTPAAPTDGGADSPPSPCATAADCDDGLFCNGDERCEMGACVPGTAPDCDDGAACTVDRCSEERLRCENVAPDVDGDGYGDSACRDGSGMPIGNDCNDADDTTFPGNFEVCDAAGHDEDCSDDTLGGRDVDGDGRVSDACCNPSAGTTRCGDDCNDTHASAYPMATEVCNGVDDDCDGTIDEGVSVVVYVDADRDGYGAGAPQMRCADAAGFSTVDGDCDDTPGTGVARSPGQPEICDGVRNDCSTTLAADAGAADVDWFRDVDGDGFGAAASGVTRSCTPVAGHSLLGTDCDDAMAGRSPAAVETCNGIDDDCSGASDFAISPGDFEDDDGDGLADLGCGAPRGVDCDDTDPASGAGAREVCDGADNDCDTRVDEGATPVVFYRDRDMDGFGSDTGGALVSCAPPVGYVARSGDCDDDAAARRPGASEICDGRDDDCDSRSDEAPASAACPDRANASGPVCSVGRCSFTSCLDAFADCDSDPGSGCETDTLADAENCGGCGRRCGPMVAGTSYLCGAGGECTVVCDATHSDCDGRADNGCEVIGTTCGGTTCPPSFIECGGAGCVDPFTNPTHCGGCDRACGAGGECVAGACDPLVSIVAGASHTCGLRARGRVVCWGDGSLGQLGVPPGVGPAPREVVLAAPAVELAAGEGHTCALLVDDRIECWGDDAFGQLGAPGIAAGTHELVALPRPAYHVAAGARHNVAAIVGAFKMPDEIFGWGDDRAGQITGVPGGTDVSPTLVRAGIYPAVAAGGTFTCYGDTGGAALCYGTLAGYFATTTPLPFRLMGATGTLARGVAGLEHVCFVADARVFCAGPGTFGELGAAPGAGLTLASFGATRALGSAGNVTCATSTLDALTCVGRNLDLELGRAGGSSMTPVMPTGLARAGALSTGVSARHVCAIDLAGRAWCWGRNDAAQATGVAGPATVMMPTPVAGL